MVYIYFRIINLQTQLFKTRIHLKYLKKAQQNLHT